MAGLLVLGLSTGLFGLAGTDRAYSRDYRRLLDSLGPTRSIEARVSGGEPYRPFRPQSSSAIVRTSESVGSPSSVSRGWNPNQEVPRLSVPSAIVRAISKADGRVPENRAAFAVLNLVDGRLEAAVRILREACDRKPDDPRILNDLAAALLGQSEVNKDPWPALESIEMAVRSIELQPSLPALFNKALALERWGLRARAIVAWKAYLEQDDHSAWADEAEQRLRQLEKEMEEFRSRPQLLATPAVGVKSFPGNSWANRQLGERILLTRWAELTLQHRTADADAALAQAEALAATSNPDAGRLLDASIAVVREAERSGDQRRLALLAHGHQMFGQAFLRWREERAAEARTLISNAIENLKAAASPFELRARVLRAWMASELDWVELRRLGEDAESRSFPTIVAEVRRIAANQLAVEGRLKNAVDVYRDAFKRFDDLGEREACSVIAALTAELLGLQGREREFAIELPKVLLATSAIVDPWDRYSIYVVTASGAAGFFSRAAVELRLEAADVCRDLHERPLCVVDSWLRVATLTPDAEVAQDALTRAEKHLTAVPNSEGKARTQIDLSMSRAHWLAHEGSSYTEQESALELLGQVVAGYESRGRAVNAARARAERARVLQRLGRLQEASAEYGAALSSFRHWDQSDRFRPAFAETRPPRDLREAYEALLTVELEKAGDRVSSAAFLLSEEMRDRLAPRRTAEFWLPGPEDLDRLTSAVPRQTAVVEYAIVADRTVAWILEGGRLDQVIIHTPEGLGERIRSLNRERNLAAWKLRSGILFESLLAPVLERLPARTERIILIPDSELYALPFRALWDSASSSYLEERFVLALAPSVRQLLVTVRDGPTAQTLVRKSVLSLGITSFSPNLGLNPLPHAASEASAVREAYRGPGEMSCHVAGWNSFLKCAPEAEVIHVATHAWAESSSSEQSGLAFEAELVGLGRLWHDLPELPRRPLIVLSACESTAAGSGEGLGGLARPFLASGARAVVGTLWKIDDAEAATYFPAFHRSYSESGNAAQALVVARENLPEWKEKPWVWGAVEIVTVAFKR